MASSRRGLAPATLLVSLVLVAGCTSDHAPRPTPSGDRRAQRVVYLVTDSTESPPLVTTTVDDLDRPFRARSVTYAGSSTDAPSRGGFAWSESRLYTINPDGSGQETQQVPPGFAGPDGHLDVALPVAERFGLVRRGARRSVLGRDCTTWSSREPLDATSFATPTRGSHTETCVDATGLILDERWTSDGKLVRSRVVTAVTTSGSLGGAGLAGPSPRPVPTELAIRRVRPTPAAELARVLQIPLPAAPLGLDGGPSASELVLTGSGGVPQPETEAAVLTWTSSQHLVVLRLSRELLRPTRPPTEGRPIRVGALGRGRLQPVYNGLRVQLLGPRGLLMTVTADLSERDLLSWIGGLSLG